MVRILLWRINVNELERLHWKEYTRGSNIKKELSFNKTEKYPIELRHLARGTWTTPSVIVEFIKCGLTVMTHRAQKREPTAVVGKVLSPFCRNMGLGMKVADGYVIILSLPAKS